MKKIVIRLAVLAVILALAWSAYGFFKSMPQRQEQIATAKVRRSDVVVRSFARGELRAVRSATLIAPNLFGTVQVTRLAALGAFAREKDLIVEFDDSEVHSRLEEKQLEIDQVDEQIKKAQAELAIRNNQDQVELLRARYSVRRSELEVKRNELLSTIDQKKNLLNLEESRRRLKQLESDIKSRLEQAQAEMAVLNERRRKAQLELQRERMRLSQVKLLAPMSGLVALKQNRQGPMFPGMTIPDIREGDQVQPGVPVAEVLDLSELEVVAKVGELDRANLKEGQDVLIQLDAVGDKTFHGKIKAMSATASSNVFSGDPAKKFDVIFSVDMKELLTGLGAKPEQIQRMLALQEANRKKPAMPAFPPAGMMMAGGPRGDGGAPGGGGGPGGGGAGGGGGFVIAGGPGGAPGAGGPGGAGGGGGRGMVMLGGPGGPGGQGGGASQMSDADRQKMRDAMQKALKGKSMQDLTPEERQKVMEEVRKAVPAMANMQRGGAGGGRGEGGARAEGGGRGGPGGGGPGGDGFPGMSAVNLQKEKEIANAKLPPPPEEDSQIDALLRPGLLADVEITIEKVPNAINIPAQAMFEKDGKQIVYVRKNNQWVESPIKVSKRSETTLILESGVAPGETIAMADPNAKPGDKKDDKPAGGPSMGLPGAGGGGGGRGSR